MSSSKVMPLYEIIFADCQYAYCILFRFVYIQIIEARQLASPPKRGTLGVTRATRAPALTKGKKPQHPAVSQREATMAEALAFSATALQAEVIRLRDGRLAERTYNARKGKWGWVVYSTSLVREAFLTDRQMEAAR
jgi:hypothetical protein